VANFASDLSGLGILRLIFDCNGSILDSQFTLDNSALQAGGEAGQAETKINQTPRIHKVYGKKTLWPLNLLGQLLFPLSALIRGQY